MHETAFSSVNQPRSSSALIAKILSVWGILLVWSLSPYADLLDHHTIGEGELPILIRLALFMIGWALMVIAMMLPGNFLKVVWVFPRAFQITRHDQLSPIYILGYLTVWIAFGGFIYLGDIGLHEAVEHFAALNSLAIGFFWSLLWIVGVYQLTSAKRACLLKAHLHYLPQDGVNTIAKVSSHPLRLGFSHGLYCLGSCWGLMLLMFAAGRMNLLVMLGLTGIMVIERISPARWQFSRLVGVCLIALAILYGMRVF